MENKLNTFKQQIEEDIKLIQERISWDKNIEKEAYAFNYWILSKIYNLDEEISYEYITEYNDKGIDCFVHYEEAKELYIIQNKYYSENTKLSSKEVSDFLTRPMAVLNKGEYKHKVLQEIYNEAKKDEDYQMYLHFYVKNNSKSDDIDNIINNNNSAENNITAEIFYLNDLYDKYYKEAYKENINLTATLKIESRLHSLTVLPIIDDVKEAYFVMTKITDLFNMYKDAKQEAYPLFEQNIREYLGTGGINRKIIETLKDKEERKKFFYYNNGITVICKSAKAYTNKVNIENPQIVNGCQTINSIHHTLSLKNQNLKNFDRVYVMVKVLVLDKEKEEEKQFYRDVVKYTNSQNSINEKVFGATHQPFFRLQKELKERGILLSVKQSDNNKFKNDYKDKKELGKLLEKANKKSKEDFLKFKNLTEIKISLEHLIQVMTSFFKDAHIAYTKKSLLLKPNNEEYYQDFSLKINEYLTVDQMIKIIILYKKSESDKKSSEDKKTPNPYYLMNFLSYYLESKKIDKKIFWEKIEIEHLKIIYDEFKNLTKEYFSQYLKEENSEYNQVIKKEVKEEYIKNILEDHFQNMEKHNKEKYKGIYDIFENLKND